MRAEHNARTSSSRNEGTTCAPCGYAYPSPKYLFNALGKSNRTAEQLLCHYQRGPYSTPTSAVENPFATLPRYKKIRRVTGVVISYQNAVSNTNIRVHVSNIRSSSDIRRSGSPTSENIWSKPEGQSKNSEKITSKRQIFDTGSQTTR